MLDVRLNTPEFFVRETRGVYSVQSEYFGGIQKELVQIRVWEKPVTIGQATLFRAD